MTSNSSGLAKRADPLAPEFSLKQFVDDRYLTLLRNASDGIHILDHEGNIIEVSDSFCRMLGYEREEMMGMNVAQWDAFFTDPEEIRSALKKQLESRVRSQFETRHRRKDGTIFAAEISGYPVEMEGRHVLFNSSRDIGRRKNLEESLEQERNFSNSILELAGPIILVIDRKGSIVRFNKTAEHFSGYSFEQVRNKPFF